MGLYYFNIFFLLIFSSFAALWANTPKEVIDDFGNHIVLSSPKMRVISLAPDISEMLYALSGDKKLIGRLEESNFPLEIQSIPIVGSYLGLDLEKIITLKPDLIIGWGNFFPKEIAFLKRKGFTVYLINILVLEELGKTIKHIATLIGYEKEGNKLANQYLNDLQRLKVKSTQRRIKVFFQLGPFQFWTISQKSLINQMISLCGGENIFQDQHLIAFQVTAESVIERNPEVIICDVLDNQWKKQWLSQSNAVKAVQNNQLYSIDPDLIERAGPRLIKGIKQICDILSPILSKK